MSDIMSNVSTFMTVKEAADYLNLPTAWIYRMIRNENAPAVKCGREWRVHPVMFTEWVTTNCMTDDDPYVTVAVGESKVG
jgi:excisionase family DNA binding protein